MNIELSDIKMGILKNLRNSQELIDESELLLNHDKYARSYLLSHISIEESSKCSILLKILAFKIWNKEIDIKKAKKRYSNHKEKIKNFELLNLILNKEALNSNDIEKKINKQNNLKNEALYVNWNNDNKFTSPNELYGLSEAKKKLEEALDYITLFCQISIELINDDINFYKNIESIKNHKLINDII